MLSPWKTTGLQDDSLVCDRVVGSLVFAQVSRHAGDVMGVVPVVSGGHGLLSWARNPAGRQFHADISKVIVADASCG